MRCGGRRLARDRVSGRVVSRFRYAHKNIFYRCMFVNLESSLAGWSAK